MQGIKALLVLAVLPSSIYQRLFQHFIVLFWTYATVVDE